MTEENQNILWKEFDFVLFSLSCSHQKEGKDKKTYICITQGYWTSWKRKLQEHNDDLVLEQSLKLHTVTTMYKLYELQERK